MRLQQMAKISPLTMQRKGCLHRLAVLAVASLSLGLGSNVAHASDRALEFKVKAAFLLNFARFTKWPDALDGNQLDVCVTSPNPFGENIDRVLKGQRSGKFTFKTHILGDENSLPPGDCELLYVSEDVEPQPLLEGVKGKPVLTVGETSQFIEKEGVIRFAIIGGKVRFVVNKAAAIKGGLQISSKLLKVAAGVVR